MSKYIDADVLIKTLDDLIEASKTEKSDSAVYGMCLAHKNLKAVVENMPAADVEPVRHGNG